MTEYRMDGTIVESFLDSAFEQFQRKRDMQKQAKESLSKMNLTHDNYFSSESMRNYMSVTQFKAFENCEAAALAEIQGKIQVDKECYKEGHYFEACITGTEELFLAQNPDMISSRGATKGELKSNYKKVQAAVETFKRQPMFMDKISRCKPQVIVKGKIAGLDFKGCVDFLDMETFEGYDTKAMSNFKKVWSDSDYTYINWFFAYGYHYQAAIYRELIRQTFGKTGTQHILAVTKEESPDTAALMFTDERLDKALEIITEYAPRYDKIKRGLIEPIPCGKCTYCKANKVVTEFEVIDEYN